MIPARPQQNPVTLVHRSTQRNAYPTFRHLVLTVALAAATIVGLPRALAQTATTGTVSGRVYKSAAGEYAPNAEVRLEGTDKVVYSGDGGYYEFSDVAAGTATISVTYSGYMKATAEVAVSAGQRVTHDFNLTAVGGSEQEIVKLGAFTVSSQREGTALAIQDQRAALNAKNVVSADNYGDVTSGNIGEFLKYMPGIVLDYTESDTRAARIDGLDPKYAGITIDGGRQATSASSSFSGTTRQFEFEQASLTNLEKIELNKTLNASLWADSGAGNVNLITKNAFDLKGRRVSYMAYLNANSYDVTMHKNVGPDDGFHYKILPGASFTYSEAFNSRVGVSLGLSDDSGYTEQYRTQLNYDYSNPAAPKITSLTFRPGPKITRRSAASANVDIRIVPNLVAKLTFTYSHFDDEYNNRSIQLSTNSSSIDPASTVTNVIANANSSTKILTGTEQHRNKLNNNIFIAPKLMYKRGSLSVNAGGSYSRSTNHYEDINKGFFSDARQQLNGISWTASRPSPSSNAWTITQTSGPSWSNGANYNQAGSTFNNNIGSTANKSTNQIFQGFIDGKKSIEGLRVPVQLSAGVAAEVNTYSGHNLGNPWRQWTFVGPTGNQNTSPMLEETNYRFDTKMGGNIGLQNLPYPNRTAMYNLYVAHPEYFIENGFGNFKNYFLSPRSLQEDTNAMYLMGDTNWRRLRFNAGVRYERTADTVLNLVSRRAADVIAAGYPVSSGVATTYDGLLYQYYNGQRAKAYNNYGNFFLSTGMKYRILSNLDAQLAWSQSIQRPDFSDLAGVVSIDETNSRVTLPNQRLKPELGNRLYGGLDLYLNPAGKLSVSGSIMRLKQSTGNTSAITPDQAAAAGIDPTQYPGYTFQQKQNDPTQRHIETLVFDYRQNLNFLPWEFKNVGVFGSITRVHADTRRTNLIPKFASGGIYYNAHGVSFQFATNWRSARMTSTGSTETLWQKEQLMCGINASYKLSEHFALFLNGSNIFNAPFLYYSNQPGLLRETDSYGTKYWTAGVKGKF